MTNAFRHVHLLIQTRITTHFARNQALDARFNARVIDFLFGREKPMNFNGRHDTLRCVAESQVPREMSGTVSHTLGSRSFAHKMKNPIWRFIFVRYMFGSCRNTPNA
ncbi:MAG: hypothetical protein ABJC26_15970, partial [Gemmatimonadaceae bacterium]